MGKKTNEEEIERLRLERLEIIAKEPIKAVDLTEEEIKQLKKKGKI